MSRLASLATPPRLVMAVFMMHAVLMTNWFPRIPDMQAKLGIGPGDLSTALLGSPIGTLIAISFGGPIVERLTPRRTILIFFTLYAAAFTLPGWATSVWTLFGALFLVGLTLPVVDVAMNVEADRIEREGGRRIMNTCHGFWSVGSIIGSITGGAFAGWAVEPRWHMLVASLVCLPIALTVAFALPRRMPVATPAGERPPIIALPTFALLGACIFAFGMLLAEAAALDWTAVFFREEMGAGPAVASIGLIGFTLFMAIGRFMGDRLAARFGPVVLARSCAIIALVGIAAVVLAPGIVIAVLGLAALGLGVSVGAPLAISSAASRGDRPAAVNVAALSLIAFTGFLVEPPLVGQVAELGGLRVGLAMVIPAIIASILLAGHVRRRAEMRAPPSPLAEVAG